MISLSLAIVFMVVSCQGMTDKDVYKLRQKIKNEICSINHQIQWKFDGRGGSIPGGTYFFTLNAKCDSIRAFPVDMSCFIPRPEVNQSKERINALSYDISRLHFSGRWKNEIERYRNFVLLYRIINKQIGMIEYLEIDSVFLANGSWPPTVRSTNVDGTPRSPFVVRYIKEEAQVRLKVVVYDRSAVVFLAE